MMIRAISLSLLVLLLAAPAAFAEGPPQARELQRPPTSYWVCAEPRAATPPVTGQGAEPVYDVLKGPGFAATDPDVLHAAMQTVGGGA